VVHAHPVVTAQPTNTVQAARTPAVDLAKHVGLVPRDITVRVVPTRRQAAA
jgi:hypothetical protein